MADTVRSVQYVYTTVRNQPGQGAKILEALKKAKINLLAFSGFPVGGGEAQIDIVAEDLPGVKRVAKANGWKLSPVKRGFVICGKDRVGAVAAAVGKLADAKINVTAVDAVSAGKGRYGMILWVKGPAHSKAAKILKAK